MITPLLKHILSAGLVLLYLVLVVPLPFVTSVWMANERNPDDGLHRRHRMADGLILRNALVGLTRKEVVAKLGEPPPESFLVGWSMTYWLGNERGFFSIDSEWLTVRFDVSGHVAEAAIVRD